MTEAEQRWIIRLSQEEGEGWDGTMCTPVTRRVTSRTLSSTREEAFQFDSARAAEIIAGQLHSQSVADDIDVEIA